MTVYYYQLEWDPNKNATNIESAESRSKKLPRYLMTFLRALSATPIIRTTKTDSSS